MAHRVADAYRESFYITVDGLVKDTVPEAELHNVREEAKHSVKFDVDGLSDSEILDQIKSCGYHVKTDRRLVSDPVSIIRYAPSTVPCYDASDSRGLRWAIGQSPEEWFKGYHKYHTKHSPVPRQAYVNDSDYLECGPAGLCLVPVMRLPNDDTAYEAHHGRSTFRLCPVAKYAEQLPEAIVKQGGFFTSMQQCEALSIIGPDWSPYALKVSLDGVNVLNGLPQDADSDYDSSIQIESQDYIAGGEPFALEGVCTAPGDVKQFLGPRLTTAAANTPVAISTRTIQFDVIPILPRCPKILVWSQRSSDTQRELDPSQPFPDDVSEVECELPHDSSSAYMQIARRVSPTLKADYELRAGAITVHVKDLTGKTYTLYVDLSDTVVRLKERYQEVTGIPSDLQRLIYNNRQLVDRYTLWYYGICDFTNVHLVLKYGGPDRNLARSGSLVGINVVQNVRQDTRSLDSYDHSNAQRTYVHFLTCAGFEEITGIAAPGSSIDEELYRSLGYPWSTSYSEDVSLVFGDAADTSTIVSTSSTGQPRKRARENECRWSCLRCGASSPEAIFKPCNHKSCFSCLIACWKSHSCECGTRIDRLLGIAQPLRVLASEENGLLPFVNHFIDAPRVCDYRQYRIDAQPLSQDAVSPLHAGRGLETDANARDGPPVPTVG